MYVIRKSSDEGTAAKKEEEKEIEKLTKRPGSLWIGQVIKHNFTIN